MSEKLPVVAAIPNYNMADSLSVLLPQVLEQEYDDVYVLDDASTDHSHEVVADFGEDVHHIAGNENVGAGGNRNRIIDALSRRAIIHFIDADMRLDSERSPEVARELMSASDLGFIGGLISGQDGQQSFWNFGPRQCLHTDISAVMQARIEQLNGHDPEHAERLRHKYAHYLRDWPNPYTEPTARRTFWTPEANMLISSNIFEAIGGYDPNIKNHEVQDLAIRLHKKGLRRGFDPLISAIHTAVQVRDGNREQLKLKAEIQIARKHGIGNYIMPDGHFRPKS